MLASVEVVNPRPVLFSVLFWIVVPAVLVAHVVGGPIRPGLVPLIALLAVLVALWFAIPRIPRLVIPAFLVVCVALIYVDGTGLVGPLLVIGLGDVVRVFGARKALWLLGLLLVTFFASAMTLTGQGWVNALKEALGIGVFCLLGISLAAATRSSARLADELKLARADLDRREEQIRLLAVAEERARLAGDMHDSLGHYLTVIKVGLENAERLRERGTERAWSEVRQAKQLTAQALADTRRTVRALRPLALDGRTGGAALTELASTFDGSGLRVDLCVSGPERALAPDVEIVLYRAFQEGMTNVLRHASASVATARLSFPGQLARLVITDDGSGASEPVDRGFGLVALAERVSAVGGAFRAGNRLGGGFELRVDLPAERS